MQDRAKKTILIYIGAVIVAACITGFGFLAFMNYYAYKRALAQLDSAYYVIDTVGVFRYGIVLASDPVKSTISIRKTNTYAIGGGSTDVILSVTPTTVIRHQTLIKDGESYVALSAATPASLSDIQSGTPVAFLATGVSASQIARIILFGNPL